MKKIYLSLLTLATFAFAACSDSESIADAPNVTNGNTAENAISFSTYMGKAQNTRAGQAGSYDTKFLQGFKHDGTGWTEGQAKAQGFGVFAYYTGTKTYGQQQGTTYLDETDKLSDIAANFMFNQQVWWNNDLGNDYITKWTYAPVKYWPNEVKNDRVDDQDNDAADNYATTTYTNGGNLSFFAYAPYVSTLMPSEASGITAINTKTTLTGDENAANAQVGDPILTYVVASDGKDIVDLLWGTYKGTSLNVNQEGNAGVLGTNATTAPLDPHTTYAAEILDGYKTNADLTKQKTNGTVGFAFKHALAKVGGSTTTTPSSSSADVKNGLLVVLDIDDMKGAETGGSKDASTKVTVRSVTIKAKSLVEASNKTPGQDGYPTTYLKKAQGDLNLATGTWKILTAENTVNTATGAAETTATINQSGENVSGKLNTTIAEPASAPATTQEGFNGLVEGVLTTVKNVYEDEAAPLVFIPGTYPELTISIDYIVRTADENLKNHYSEVEQVITKKLTFTKAVELNKQYSIIMHLGLTSVKFTAEVSDWDVANDNPNYDSDNDGVVDIRVEDVHLPINVAGLMINYTTALTSAANASYTPDAGTLYYYDGAEKKTVNSGLAYVTAPSGDNAWVGTMTASTGAINIAANDTYDSREATFQVKYTSSDPAATLYSDFITLTQPGKKPSEVNVTWSTDPDPAFGTEKVKAGGDVTFAVTDGKVTVKGKESDNTTDFTQNEVVPTDYIFIDDATRNVATWITKATSWTVANGTWTVAANPSTSNRSATLYAVVKGHRVVVKASGNPVKLTQKGTAE